MTRVGIAVNERKVFKVEAAYGAGAVNIPITESLGFSYDSPAKVDSGKIIAHHRRFGLQLVGSTGDTGTIQYSLDRVNWVNVDVAACINSNATKNQLPSGGGVAFVELPVPVALRVSFAGVATPSYELHVLLYGEGEIGKASATRSS